MLVADYAAHHYARAPMPSLAPNPPCRDAGGRPGRLDEGPAAQAYANADEHFSLNLLGFGAYKGRNCQSVRPNVRVL
jgi:hypothetical protein